MQLSKSSFNGDLREIEKMLLRPGMASMDMGFKVQQTRRNIKEAPTEEEIAADVPGLQA